jgi:N6-L-threonylcarbamoyladenine synthase
VIDLCLAIETSCDDTSVAVVRSDGFVLGVRSANQDVAHAPFGGIVPEIACRNHSLNLLPLIDETLRQTGIDWPRIQGIAVTNRPGLIGSLIVGLVTAKSLAQARGLALIGVNHLEGHILAPFLRDDSYKPAFEWTEPFLALAVSGGHTSLYRVEGLGRYEILGATLDDAAGEAFDKFAKMAGLSFPGGVKVDRLSREGDRTAFAFPRSMLKEENYLMSFSGLKSSAQRLLESMSVEEIQQRLPDLCASFQEAIVDVLIGKLDRAVAHTGIKNVVVTGGVSANSRLRERAEEWARGKNLTLQIPPLRYCTDNAAMIGYAGILRLNRGERSDLKLGPSPSSWPEDFTQTAGR